MTTAICFDLDGTLLRFERDYADILTDVFAAELDGIDAFDGLLETADDAFYAAFDAMDPDPAETAMDAVLTAAGVDGDPEAMATALLDVELVSTTVPEGTHESLQALGESNRLAVITNGVPAWQEAKLVHHDLLEYFETVVCSYEVGAHKPDPAPFEEAKRRVEADQYVMVGDDYEADVEGGRAAGFVPVHVEHGEETPEFWATLRAMV